MYLDFQVPFTAKTAEFFPGPAPGPCVLQHFYAQNLNTTDAQFFMVFDALELADLVAGTTECVYSLRVAAGTKDGFSLPGPTAGSVNGRAFALGCVVVWQVDDGDPITPYTFRGDELASVASQAWLVGRPTT